MIHNFKIRNILNTKIIFLTVIAYLVYFFIRFYNVFGDKISENYLSFWDPNINLFALVSLFLVSLQLVKKIFKIKKTYYLSITFIIVSFLILQNIYIIFFGLFLFIVFYMTGRLFHGLLKVVLNKNDCLIYYLSGLGVVGLLVYILETANIHNTNNYILFCLTVFLFSMNNLRQIINENIFIIKNNVSFNPFVYFILFIYFMVICMPEIGYDALAHHLFIPSTMKWQGFWGNNINFYVYSVMPHLVDQVYSFVFILSENENLIKAVNFFSLLISIYMVKNILVLNNFNLKYFSLVSLSILTFPMSYLLASTAFIDLTFTAFVTSSLYFLLKFTKNNNTNYLLLGSIFLGFSLASKALSLVYIFVYSLFLFIFLIKENNLKTVIKFLVIFIVPIFIIGSYPYINAYIVTENPLFPLYNNIFKSPYYSITAFFNGYTSGMSYDFIDKITFDSTKYIEGYKGSSGFLIGMLFLPTIVLSIYYKNKNALKLLLISALLIYLLCLGTAYLRYIYSAMVIMIAGIFLFFGTIIKDESHNTKIKKIFIVLIVLSILANVTFLNKATHAYGIIDKNIITNEKDRKSFLLGVNPISIAIEKINKLNTDNENVLFYSYPFTYNIHANAIIFEWYNTEFQNKLLFDADSAYKLNILFDEYKIKYIIFDPGYPKRRFNMVWDDKKINEMNDLIKKETVLIERIGLIEIRKIREK